MGSRTGNFPVLPSCPTALRACVRGLEGQKKGILLNRPLTHVGTSSSTVPYGNLILILILILYGNLASYFVLSGACLFCQEIFVPDSKLCSLRTSEEYVNLNPCRENHWRADAAVPDPSSPAVLCTVC
eukprot:COSAG02_NODE_1422_length_12685_cov_69.610361_4_plen_128_part_00